MKVPNCLIFHRFWHFSFDKNNYTISYSEKVSDFDCNYITNLDVKNKTEFNNMQETIKSEMHNLKRKVCYIH